MNTKTIKKYLPLAAIAAGCLYVINKGHVVSGVGIANNQKPARLHELIKENIINSSDTPEEAIQNVRHYIEGYGDEPDFNLVQSASLMPVDYWGIAELLKEAGYSENTLKRLGDQRMWDFYLWHVGAAARELVPTRMRYNRGRIYYELA